MTLVTYRQACMLRYAPLVQGFLIIVNGKPEKYVDFICGPLSFAFLY